MRRAFSFVLALSLMLCFLAACQKNSTEGQPKGSTTSSVTAKPTASTSSKPTASVSSQPSSDPSTSHSSNPSTKPSASPTPSVSVTPTKPTTPAALELPYVIPNTGLIIEKISSYDGLYVEDGSNSEIKGVAMILLRNMGSKDIGLANITLHYGTLIREFSVSSLPKGMSIVVQEKNRNAMAQGKLDKVTASVIENNDEFDLSPAEISITAGSDNTLTVKNLTNRDLPDVRIFYKYFMEDQQLLVGGITFTVNITNLKAGQETSVKSAHFLTGNSTIVMVQTYEVSA